MACVHSVEHRTASAALHQDCTPIPQFLVHITLPTGIDFDTTTAKKAVSGRYDGIERDLATSEC